MKRFWRSAEIGADETGGDPGGYVILLDGKPMHLPGGEVLRIVPRRLAEAVAAEWTRAGGEYGGEMSFEDTPLTRLAGTAQIRISPDPAATIDALARHGETDLLCYRAESPRALAQRQSREWQPWLDWAALTYDAPLRFTHGIVHIRQDQQALAALRRALAARDPYALAALGVAVPALGSLVLGLALADGALDAGRAHGLAALDELFQAEFWGTDAQAEARRAAIASDIELAARMIELVRP